MPTDFTDLAALHKVRSGADLPSETTRRPMTPLQLAQLRSDPRNARRMIELVDASEHLITFSEAYWKVLDPGVPFVNGWAIGAIAEHLEAVTLGQIKKLLINVPPGFSKSLLTCVYWPAWEWGPKRRPHERYVTTSYDQALVIRDNIRCRNLLLSDEYQMVWGDIFKMADDQNTKIRFSNDKTGWKAAKAITGLTGDRGSRFIFDDPQSVLGAESEAEVDTIETSFAHAMPTRVQTKDDAFVGIMQRLRENDIAGFILANKLGYDHLVIPMHVGDKPPKFISHTRLNWIDPRTIPSDPSRGYFRVEKDENGHETRTWVSSWHDGMVRSGYLASPERFPPEQVEDLEKTMATKGGTAAIAGQLEQEPYPEGGTLFERAWFRVMRGKAPAHCVRVRGWDFASSLNAEADWTVGVLMARWVLPEGVRYVIEDVVRFRGKPGTVRKRIKATAVSDTKKVHVSIPKDPGPGGEWAAADIVNDLAGWKVHASREDKDKATRAKPVAAQAEMGYVYISDHLVTKAAEQCPGEFVAEVFIREHVAFPNGKHDDHVDGTSRAFGHLTDLPEPSPIGADPIEIDTTLDAESVYEGDVGAIY